MPDECGCARGHKQHLAVPARRLALLSRRGQRCQVRAQHSPDFVHSVSVSARSHHATLRPYDMLAMFCHQIGPERLLWLKLAIARRYELSKPGVVAGAFATAIAHQGRSMWGLAAHLFAKTYYAPALLKPWGFLHGLRAVFGDQTMFVRADDFESVGGFDERWVIMEDADLGLRLHQQGSCARPGQVRGPIRRTMLCRLCLGMQAARGTCCGASASAEHEAAACMYRLRLKLLGAVSNCMLSPLCACRGRPYTR